MQTTTILLISAAVLAVVKGDGAIAVNNNLIARTDNFISMNRVQFARILDDQDTKLNTFKQFYAGRVDGVNVQLDMVTASIVQTEERLNPLEVLSDFSKQCATKYRSSIPTVLTTKTAITRCFTDASSQITNLITNPFNTRNSLDNYFKNYFEKEILNCAKNYDNRTSNYTSCITNVATNTKTYAISNQNTFGVQMDAAECTAKAYIKRALDCSYNVQTNTISKIAEANVMINNCLVGKDECTPCDERNSCPYSSDLKVDFKNETITNPFYGLKEHSGCLMLKLY